jgi:hypothetical protein
MDGRWKDAKPVAWYNLTPRVVPSTRIAIFGRVRTRQRIVAWLLGWSIEHETR